MSRPEPVCLYCQRASDQVPLINMIYLGDPVWICPQHLPILIHRPSELADKLPGMEGQAPPAKDEQD